MTELEFQNQVTELAEILGWSWVHFRPAQTARGWRTPVSGPLGKGWPDLVLVRGRDCRMVFAELKGDKGKTTPAQEFVLGEIRRVARSQREDARPPVHNDPWLVGYTPLPWIDVFVWRPSDFDQIAEILR